MKEIVKTTSTPVEPIDEGRPIFKGYTLEELRYQRAVITLKKEFCQSKLLRSVDSLKKTNPLSSNGSNTSLPGKFGFVASKLLAGLNYLDYAMLGFSLFSSARKVFSFLHRKK